MAQLLTWLALAGAHDSAGNPVSSGTAWFYQPGGGTTTATVYSDVNATVVASNPATLDAAGRATVYVISPVRIVIQNASGASVSDADQADVNRAETLQLANTGWSDTYLDGVLTKLYTSTGGVDGQYQESSGATARPIHSKFAELSISVKDFGAKGDGLTVDTTAVTAAFNRVGFLGGGEVYFPPGTYLVDLAIAVSKNGVSMRGAGPSASIIQNTNASGNLFNLSGSTFKVQDLQITNSGAGSGTAFTLTSVLNALFVNVTVSGHDISVVTAGSCSYLTFLDCTFTPGGDASGRGISLAAVETLGVYIAGCQIGSGGGSVSVDCAGTLTKQVMISGGQVDVIKLAAGAQQIAIEGCSVTTFTYVSTAPKFFYQSGNGIDGSTQNVTTGNSVTIDRSTGPDIRINANAGGAGVVTVGAPTPVPHASQRGVRMTTRHVNAAGGAVTWTMNAAYVLDGATAIPTTDGHTILVDWLWDNDSSKWRELGRTNTVT